MRMSAIAEKALRGSIRKWQKIVSGKGLDHHAKNCPLCVQFIQNNCDGCPVARKTKEAFCEGSPYEKWEDALGDMCPRNDSGGYDFYRYPEARLAAKEELEFLKSLLPVRMK